MESPRFRPAFTPTLLLPLALVLSGPLTQAQAAGLQTFDAPGAVVRQETDFGDASGYGRISGECFSLGAGMDVAPLLPDRWTSQSRL